MTDMTDEEIRIAVINRTKEWEKRLSTQFGEASVEARKQGDLAEDIEVAAQQAAVLSFTSWLMDHKVKFVLLHARDLVAEPEAQA